MVNRWSTVLRAWPLAALAVSLGLTTSCTRRFALTRGELARVNASDEGVHQLHVFPRKRLISVYQPQEIRRSYGVRGTIEETKNVETLHEIVTRNTPGEILQVGELKGAAALWVSWDEACDELDCAYIFVYSRGDRFLLAAVPKRDDYWPARSFRSSAIEACKLQPGRLKSLAEVNEVYHVRRKRLRPLVLELQVKKDLRQRRRARKERASGRE